MSILKVGSVGAEVRAWQTFLIGEGWYRGEVTGMFDQATRQATVDFQRNAALMADGVVGPKTLTEAQARGLPGPEAPDASKGGPGWPPAAGGPLSWQQRGMIFGSFAYRPEPTASNPEGIVITDGWATRNITMVEVPQLAGIPGAPPHGRVAFHTKAADQFAALWAAWEAAGLLPLVKTWAGSWAPRFVRGSRTNLSNHAWGTAFDINAGWNGLGKTPAVVGREGSVRELVPLAQEHGFYWGGHFPGRPDGMHFEVRELV